MVHHAITVFRNQYCIFFFLLLPAFVGCSASTTFRPPNDHRAYLGMAGGDFTLTKDSGTSKISENPERLLDCDTLAQALSIRAAQNYNTGRSLEIAGAILDFVIPVVGVILSLNGDAHMHTGAAGLIDAINIHNDQAECLHPAEEPAVQPNTPVEHRNLIIPVSVEIPYNSTTAILDKQVHIKCMKKRESAFFSKITLSFDGVDGVDKNQDGSFAQFSLSVKKDEVFFVRLNALLLRVWVAETNDRGVTLNFIKQ